MDEYMFAELEAEAETEAEEMRWKVEELILGMADIVYENRKLRRELKEANEFKKKYYDLLNDSVENANKHTASLLAAIMAGAFSTKEESND